MTNFETIQKMTLEQLAYTFYIAYKPFLEGFSDEEKKGVYDQLVDWLKQEVPNGKP